MYKTIKRISAQIYSRSLCVKGISSKDDNLNVIYSPQYNTVKEWNTCAQCKWKCSVAVEVSAIMSAHMDLKVSSKISHLLLLHHNSPFLALLM